MRNPEEKAGNKSVVGHQPVVRSEIAAQGSVNSIDSFIGCLESASATSLTIAELNEIIALGWAEGP